MKKKGRDSYLIYVLLAVGFIFLRSGYGKIAGGTFVDGLGKTLGFFASKNPNPGVKAFLTDIAMPNATLFAMLTMWGELAVAVSIIVPVVYYLVKRSFTPMLLLLLGAGLAGAAFLNGVFWLASGWTSPSTDSVNLLMLVISLVGLVFVLREYTVKK